jgi:hypothetical protein
MYNNLLLFIPQILTLHLRCKSEIISKFNTALIFFNLQQRLLINLQNCILHCILQYGLLMMR